MAKLTLFSKIGSTHDWNSSLISGPRSWWSGVGVGLACSALLLSGTAEAGEREPYWVFFVDKGVSPDQLPLALEQQTAHLTPRALARRQLRGKVYLNEGDLPVAQRYENAVLATGVKLRARSRWLNAISVEADSEELTAISQLPAVIKIQPVARGTRIEPPSTPVPDSYTAIDQGVHAIDYGMAEGQLTSMGVPTAHECGLMGEGIVVGMLDSGFRTDHTAFSELDIIGTWDFINDNEGVDNEAGDGDSADQNTHGTNCLSLMSAYDPGNFLGPAPRVQVLLAKTEDVPTETMVEEDYYVAGLEWVEEEGADISTSSLGYVDWYDRGQGGDLDGETAVTTVAVNEAVARGLIALTAAGNDGPGSYTMIAPADSPVVLTIGATNVAGTTIASFSSRGPTSDDRMKPNIVAPGQSVAHVNKAGGYSSGSGTSYATPLAAGGVALVLQAHPDWTPEQMMTRLHETASQNSSPDNTWGYGLIDIAELVEDYCSCTTDGDSDGYNDSSCGGNDCDDTNPDINPGADEICDDGVDNDCDGLVDDADDDCGGGESGSGSDSGEESGEESSGGEGSGEGSESGEDSESEGGEEEESGEEESSGGEEDESESGEGDEASEDGEGTGGEDESGSGGDVGTDGSGDDGPTGDGPGDDSVGGDDMMDAGADQGGDDSGGQADDTGGCTCSAQPSGWTGFSGLLVLLALRRRRTSPFAA